MTRRHSTLLVLILAACIAPEQGIDDTVVHGFVRVPAVRLDESGANDTSGSAQSFEPLPYGYAVIQGTIDEWSPPEEGEISIASDEDWFRWSHVKNHTATITVWYGDGLAAPPALPMPADTDTDTDVPTDTDTDVADTDLPTDTDVVDTDLPTDTDLVDTDVADTDVADTDTDVVDTADTGEPTGPVLRLEIWNLDELDARGNPTRVLQTDLTGGEGSLELEVVANTNYAIRLGGLYGEGEVPYRIGVLGPHPDTAAIKVGAYGTGDTTNLGLPLGGATVRPFELQSDLTWLGEYELISVKTVATIEAEAGGADQTTVTEGASAAWLVAGDFTTLNSGLRAGIFYSADPIEVALPGGRVELEEVLLLDALAPAVIGLTFSDEEPNDVVADINSGDADVLGGTAQALGLLSVPGFVDVITGGIAFANGDASWDHDVDAFSFQVPQAVSELFFTLDWEGDDVDLDILVIDPAVGTIDLGYYNHPEVNEYGTGPLEPDVEYYLVVIGYLGDPTVETPYDLRVELAP